ncbi:hypothetical protein GOB94_07535 [Granulicella sp. 5B5]|uniref:ArnT family glycosyltransferase n=1 Tax=Granulicella sp. 5B5 TaxID=1617967 RepID=UPI0015F47240|nr:glycosyltransferase family 39 protein [Granulicella sp. 5B5]QMV18552.1 hypothetical protein GOB94_07535 [Granulicella sp. 5B5]
MATTQPTTQPAAAAHAERPAALRSTVLAALLAALVILTLLGHNRLTDWDEGIYAQISREMLSSGLLIPHWNLQPWLEKPPLMLWITAVFFKLFGVSEFTARLGSALSGVALVGLLHGWLARRHSLRAAWFSSLILLSTFGFLHVARVGEMDTLLSLGLCISLIGLAELHLDHRHGAWLFWLGFALALMTKGAASITLGFTFVLFLALEPTILRRHLGTLSLGFALFLAVVLPWHIALYHRFGEAFVQQYIGLHILHRATSQIEGHITPWWYYLRVLLLSAIPFCLLYPIAALDALRRPALRLYRVFALFALIEVLFFSLVKTRLPHYIAPAYPAFSVLTAVWICTRLETITLTKPLRLRLSAAVCAIWIIAALITAAPRSRLHSPRLPNGDVTPNNREQVALLKQVFKHPAPAVAAVPGPLLDWRPGHYNPIPTVIFYANRPVQQVLPQPLPPGTPTDIYAFNPVPFAAAIGSQPSLILVARSLLPQLPAGYTFHLIASSPTLAVGTIARN